MSGSEKFTLIYEKHKRWMLTVAYNIVQNHSTAEDVVHKAFIKIMENLDGLDDPESQSTKSFCGVVVYHEAINEYNRDRLHEVDNIDDLYELSSDKMGDAIDYILQKEGYNYLIDTIKKLPIRHQRIFWLRYYYYYNYNVIGAIMQITPENARQICNRARNKIKSDLGEKGD